MKAYLSTVVAAAGAVAVLSGGVVRWLAVAAMVVFLAAIFWVRAHPDTSGG